MKKFVNDPQQFVPEMLKGIQLANPGKLKYVPEYNLIMRADAPNENKVSIVQGSGSGHEPAHVMVVGKGMLDAACPGDVFAAPPSDYVYETTKLLASPKGVLHIINNYTGDRMAFDMGRELAEAEDIKIATIIVDDDVAVKDSTYTVGRRGVAGNFFVIKAVGAAAEKGAELDELVKLGERVNSVTRTMGMALTSCTPPAKGSPLFDLGDDEMEMGVGIHGEPGRRREKLANADAIVDELLEAVASDLPYSSGDDVALMINGLGGTPISELYILYGRAHDQLAQRGINVTRSYVGEYCTSLDMAGASLTLVKLDDELNALFDAPAEVAVRVFNETSGAPSGVTHDVRRSYAGRSSGIQSRTTASPLGSARSGGTGSPAAMSAARIVPAWATTSEGWGPAATTASARRVRSTWEPIDSPPGNTKSGSPASKAANSSGER